MARTAYSVTTLDGVPMVAPGDDLAGLARDAMARTGLEFQDGDILVACHKIVSKAENCFVDLATVTPGARARDLSAVTGKPAELCEVILSESRDILRQRGGLVITRNRLGHVVANSAVDQSNVGCDTRVLVLPRDPDASAASLRDRLEQLTGRRIGVIITDSFGRAWRVGTLGTAIGVAGPPVIVDQRGRTDATGRVMQATMPAIADALAAAAVLAMGEADEGTPMALIRGVRWTPGTGRAADAIRPAEEDMFT